MTKPTTTTKRFIITAAIIAGAFGLIKRHDIAAAFEAHKLRNATSNPDIVAEEIYKNLPTQMPFDDYEWRIPCIVYEPEATGKGEPIYLHKKTGVLILADEEDNPVRIDKPSAINKVKIDAYIPQRDVKRFWTLAKDMMLGNVYRHNETGKLAYIDEYSRIRQIVDKVEDIDRNQEPNYFGKDPIEQDYPRKEE